MKINLLSNMDSPHVSLNAERLIIQDLRSYNIVDNVMFVSYK